MDDFDFQTFFNEKLRERGWNLKKLSELSGIPLKYLEFFSQGSFDKLPPAPYLHGYLIKLGRILDFDAESCWGYFQKSDWLKTLVLSDRLPQNRFARKPLNKYFWLILIIAALALYFAFRFTNISGQPLITVFYPQDSPMKTNSSSIVLVGKMAGGDELLINGENVLLGQDNSWQKNLSLQPGMNTVEISAQKFLGRETRIIRQIIYEPPAASSTSAP